MFIRKAKTSDIKAASAIYDEARKYMQQQGNPDQWKGDYPNGDDVLWGIKNETSYVCEEDGEILATFYFEMNADDPTYYKIYEGRWKNELPYSVIHRIAVKYHGKGIVDFCFNECFKISGNIKIDTHRNNIPMQKCLVRNGFEYCGIIYLENGEERMAYQKA